MSATKTPTDNLLSRSLQELRANRKKAVLLAGLAAVAGFIAFRSLGGTSAPTSAAAKPAEVPAVKAGSAVAAPAAPAGNPENERRREEYINSIDRNVTRDVFDVHLSVYPLIEPAASTVVTPVGPSEPDPDAVTEAQNRAREAHAQSIRLKAGTLALQGTMNGTTTTAIINNTLVKVGDEIGGFVVKEIGNGQCVLEREAVQVTLARKIE